MYIRIIGKEIRSRWTLEVDGKLISLCGCDYLIMLSLAVVWINNKDNSLSKDYLFGDLTSKYIHRLKYNIHRLAGINTDNLIKHTHFGKYRLNVEEVIIEIPAYSFDDNRFKKVLEKIMHSTGTGTKDDPIQQSDYIHIFFGLSYANYLVLHRSILQSMNADWQKKFVALLAEMEELYDDYPNKPAEFMVKAKNDDGKFTHDPFADYERGRRFIEPLKI